MNKQTIKNKNFLSPCPTGPSCPRTPNTENEKQNKKKNQQYLGVGGKGGLELGGSDAHCLGQIRSAAVVLHQTASLVVLHKKN
jgi:hypothetical protein